MSSLSNVEAKLPPGFRFHPKDEELIWDYLMKWVTGCPHPFPLLVQVDLNKCEPWDIPESACVGGKEWYFYSQKDKKYATGLRTNRATGSGYWKATGKDRPVIRKGTLVGMRKTLVFYEGRAPKGRKTDWVMHEFRLEGTHWSGPKVDPPVNCKEDWVLCRVLHKNSLTSPGKQETGNFYDVTPSSASLPPLMEPYMTFDQSQAGPSGHQNREQVPCFSIFSPTSPTFSHVTHTDTIMPDPSFGGTAPDLEFYNYSINECSSSNQMSIKAVLNYLESQPNMNGSPSFGEGSSDSHLSDVGNWGLPSMWNHYS